eukprot:TRINITY_DN66557_c7_g1_i1.p1 TRINITY_DN66557_c7_g1~~TRINITY_DN66557_c7_g1_i1.p1  ORF type:complete len:374 (+),score=219.91 TRINITY_DN66557_c7_g1_i1:1-1122(+)
MMNGTTTSATATTTTTSSSTSTTSASSAMDTGGDDEDDESKAMDAGDDDDEDGQDALDVVSAQMQMQQANAQQHHHQQQQQQPKTNLFPPVHPQSEPRRYFKTFKTLRQTIYGKVKLGMAIQSQERVAIKLSKLSRMQARNGLENPAEEIRLMAGLSRVGHPNVLKLLGVYQDDKYHWTILEFCGRGEFFDIIANNGRLRPEMARKYFRQLVLALQFMHGMGVCHLDVSLENMMMDDNYDCKVIDFGMARQFTSTTVFQATPTEKPGKLGYMAPEIYAAQQFRGDQADIYSAGVVLFMMLTGTPPYNMPTRSDARFKLVYSGNIRKLLAHWNFLDLVGDAAADLMQRMLAPPNQRITIAQILAHPWMTATSLD